MSRLEDAEKRLYDAISQLDRALTTRFNKEKDHITAIENLKIKLEQSNTERDDIEKRLKTAALRVGETIERLRKVLNE
tara:strand:+ start:3386 stop:3619 length:234 start_codon:yes stop_codon:yes gene_type:complete